MVSRGRGRHDVGVAEGRFPMTELWTRFQIWSSSERGASLVEYALLLLLLAVVAIAVISQVGDTTSAAFSRADEGF